jgi:glycosidase
MLTSLFQQEVEKVLLGKNVKFTESPADWRDQWIYFLLVDRFNNPHSKPVPDEYPCNVYQGGNFEGIIKKLSYLKKLGAGAIWISPVLFNPQWFHDYWGGYGIQNYLRIDPRFCSHPAEALKNPEIADNEFRKLIDEAHKHGIYIILDIVLNHMGDVFNYPGFGDSAPWKSDGEYKINWRDHFGDPHMNWTDISSVPNLPLDAGIWPKEFQKNDFFRRKGDLGNNTEIERGDFYTLKELVTEYLETDTNTYPVRNLLIRSFQYLIAKFDLDGYRIDTLQYIEPEFARIFGNSMREFGLSIGKKNFFMFGEVWNDDDEIKIAEFIGRNTEKNQELIGIDAVLDFPVRKRLHYICKGMMPPSELAMHYDYRRTVLKSIVSSHGDVSGDYVTFIDNHDLNSRFNIPLFPDQTKIMLTCLMTIQGIPCIYYGTEQGLDGNAPADDQRREYVREALWSKPDAFSEHHDFYKLIQELSKLRNDYPALKYGRQYFRACSESGTNFNYSSINGGLVSFSRILNDREILVVANTSVEQSIKVYVVVDKNLNPAGNNWKVIFSTNNNSYGLIETVEKTDCHAVMVTLDPMEAQILVQG